MSDRWYVQILGEEHGPHTANEIRRMAASGHICPDYLVRRNETGDWKLAESIKGLAFGQRGDPIEMGPVPSNATKFCPSCRSTVPFIATKCKHCGHSLESGPAKLHSRKQIENALDTRELLAIAKSQKAVTVIVVSQLLAVAVSVFLPVMFAVYFWILIYVLFVYFIFKLCISVEGIGAGLFFSLLSLIPVLGIVALLIVNSSALKKLKQNGLEPTFFGVPDAKIAELQRRI
jgi:hypothetical protein